MKMEISVTEAMELINEICQQPEPLLTSGQKWLLLVNPILLPAQNGYTANTSTGKATKIMGKS